MRKGGKGILKSLSASPCPFGNPFQLSKISGEESNDLIGLSIVERTGYNGMGREEWHKKLLLNRLIVQTVHIIRLMLLTVLTTYPRIVEIFPIYSPSPSYGGGLGWGWKTHLVPLPFIPSRGGEGKFMEPHGQARGP